MGSLTIKKVVFLFCLTVAAVCLASITGNREKHPRTRLVKAGLVSFAVPAYFPREAVHGTATRGAAIIGEMDERQICYEQFVGIYWSDRPIPDADLAPAPAYQRIPDWAGRPSEVTGGQSDASLEHIHFRAEKPCGKVINADLAIARTYCPKTAVYYAVTGLLDTPVTVQQLAEIAASVECK